MSGCALSRILRKSVARAIDFGVAVDLAGEDRPGFQDAAGFLAFRGSNCGCFLMSFAFDAGFSAG